MRSIITRPIYAMLAAVVFGCAGAQVTGQTESAPVANSRPGQIVVYPFSVASSEVTLNQSLFQRTYREWSDQNQSQEQLDLAHQTAHNVCVQVAADLTQKGYTARCLDRGITPSGDNVLIVDGEFNNISEGNRLRRLVIGLGTGQSVIDTTVVVAQKTSEGTQQLMEFATHADSGSTPGAAIMGAPGMAVGGAAAVASVGANVAAGGVKNYRSSTGSLADMTVKQVVDQVTNYYLQQRWAAAS